ncbi:MAG: hypothetical protein M1823_001933 [Watsoniomyces obsoletus]|nr:MAG: hypothetical protein M1823_001933 [Watsoniomyces obsoletus]
MSTQEHPDRRPKRQKTGSASVIDREAMMDVNSTSSSETLLPRIELNETETTLTQLLLDVGHHIDNHPLPCPEGSEVTILEPLANSPTVIRFTGGWVRDKLLGVESHDIDVAINNSTGYQFGLRMQEYLAEAERARRYGIHEPVLVAQEDSYPAASNGPDVQAERTKALGGLHTIKKNPEKSKHLETVTTKIFGLDIDLVNLRTETYAENSRNPQMAIGTPEDDALRRDATVNAMFYNLNTSSLEDFTGRGQSDMQAKIIRTPLEPRQTFLDDPLRVLRLVRFASRLDYSIEHETEQAMDDDEIRTAFLAKISRERVGIEMDKMLKGNGARQALALIDRLNLYSIIFPPPATEKIVPDMNHWKSAYGLIDEMVHLGAERRVENGTTVDDLSVVAGILLQGEQDIYMAWLLAALVPWRTAPLPPLGPKGQLQPPMPAVVVRDGIKATNKVFEIVVRAFRNVNEVSTMRECFTGGVGQAEAPIKDVAEFNRESFGMAIRRWGPSWRMQVLFALLMDVVRTGGKHDHAGSNRVISNYADFLAHLRKLDVLEAYALKPIVDGKQIVAALNVKPGKWTGAALDLVMRWQLRNPGVTDGEGAIEEVRKHREELKIN